MAAMEALSQDDLDGMSDARAREFLRSYLHWWRDSIVRAARSAWRDSKYNSRARRDFADLSAQASRYLTDRIHPLEQKLGKKLTPMPNLETAPSIHNSPSLAAVTQKLRRSAGAHRRPGAG